MRAIVVVVRCWRERKLLLGKDEVTQDGSALDGTKRSCLPDSRKGAALNSLVNMRNRIIRVVVVSQPHGLAEFGSSQFAASAA